MRKSKIMQRTAVSAAISAICSVMAGQALAQEAVEEVVVTGIRGSLTNAMDIKRNSSGVVDAISAEDMGKFPDTNLSESLQRVTGVSIDRVEGEGSRVTVRGFGPQFNLVTLNGRQMPAADVQNVGSNEFNAAGNSRSFDFSVLASEGVSGLQVYKTGRASAPTGGIGATINVNTLRPLDVGNQFALSAKAVDDAGADNITPEFNGVMSWVNDNENLGVSLFASYQEREGSARSGTNGNPVWLYPYDPNNGAVDDAINVNPPEPGSLASFPSNSRIEYAETFRERTNTMLTLQFAPSDSLRITADAMYSVNNLQHNSLQDQQFLARNFDYVEWDGNNVVAVPLVLSETHSNTDPAAPFTEIGTDLLNDNRWAKMKDEMTSVGLNFAWDYSDELSFALDLASSTSESGGDWPGGWAVYRATVGGAVSGWRALDYSGDVTRVAVAITDGGGNQNGIYEVTDVSSQTFQANFNEQKHDLDQIQLSGSWEASEGIKVDFGVGHIKSEMKQFFQNYSDFLGGWGAVYAGDIEATAPGLMQQICTACQFRDLNYGLTPELEALAPPGSQLIYLGQVSWWVNPRAVAIAMDGSPKTSPSGTFYDFENPTPQAADDNTISEDMTSAYLQATMDGQIGGKDMQVLVGVRWENTDVSSASIQRVPQQIYWISDNDRVTTFGSDLAAVTEDYSYNDILPSLDFQVDLTDDFKLRASLSKTIARPQYNFMFVKTNVAAGSTLTYLGGIPSGNRGTAKLEPLESYNFDLSLEYYYGESSYASVGFFQKAVSNFVGIETVTQPQFDLRDVTGRDQFADNRLNQAIVALQAGGWDVNEESLFTMTAILDNPQDFPNGAADYDGTGPQAVAVFQAYDVFPDSDDPLYQFAMALPVNNQTANIDGWEVAWQHFFGDTGFGLQANATIVNGDIAFDNGAPPTFDQFALEGLSDSANLILVWENESFGARVAYNWRDKFLNRTNVGNFNPQYMDEHGQLDLNFSYNVNDHLSLSLDGINLTEEGVVARGRTDHIVYFAKEYDARWVLSARYSF
ncbi:MAG: TonB-dependent receptor [Gammaproteobacteria bacterium]|nr:TonB-dependent receptor [Gammaproteobacteria bacterium]MDH5322917.1 TonB-dependent receptor [Gammaproteobacteria bacterium]